MKISTMLAVGGALNRLLSYELPADAALRLSVSTKAMAEAAQKAEEMRMKIIRKHGTPKDGGFVVLDGNRPGFDKEMEAFVESEAPKVELSIAFDDIKALALPTSVLQTLGEWIKQ